MTNTYVIADLHGRFDLFTDAVSQIDRREQYFSWPTRLVVLGDFVDRGPNSRGIIDLLMHMQTEPQWDLIVLQGNHEAMMLECLSNPAILRWWIGNGGGETLRSYGYAHGDQLTPLKIPAEHLQWLAGLPIAWQDDHRIYVHAGVPFDQALEDAKDQTLQWMLYSGDSDEHYADAQYQPDSGVAHVSGKHIVHGHHQSASHPLLKAHRTNLDSLAWNTGRLAIGVFDNAKPGGPTEILWSEGDPA